MALIRWEPFRDIERYQPFRRDIERWEPFREIDTLQRQINRLFDRLIPTEDGERTGLSFIPAAELEETENEIRLRLEVPGLEAKDINVEVTADSVTITGERKFESQTQDNGVTRSEFRYGKFQRIIQLPSLVENDKVQAEYKNGVLHLTLPKAESEKHKAVKVNLGQ
ncbi:Hsp20/alpha crystallin family protein [Nostoc sp. CENA67]|uniref:Hsp20/alpha crystallin family protein n=1 Tax=Amazonocrinis nigriterrae CENA67 TaxID=2794033 RepID=A0A8J7HU72_9NOST|nr:Hsp20/alpha crystallin family protein [Amazonocrinis nigriterrae]MBH8565812.1 Hsp20/alpha crystallin family protein [Amazonocrinis nigriterrae CENA67]